MKKLIGYSLFAIFLFVVVSSCNSYKNKENKADKTPELLSTLDKKASAVFLTNNAMGIPLVSWVETDSSGAKQFYFAKMDTVKDVFADPQLIPIAQNAMAHAQMIPKMAVKGDGTLVAIYGISTPYKNLKWGLGDVQYIQSFDEGKTWTAPRSVAPELVKKGLSINYTGLSRLGDGELGMTWLGTNPDATVSARPIYFAKTEGKKGFAEKILINNSACECCETTLSSDSQGLVSVAFRDILPGSVRDISLSTSTDNGRSFSPAVSFSDDDWVVDGCPHNGPSIVTAGKDTYATWFTGAKGKSGVYYATLDSSEKRIDKKYLDPEGRFIQLCMLPNGTRVAAYNQNISKGDSVYSRIVVVRINKKGFFRKVITPTKIDAAYPVIEADGNDKVVVAWMNEGQVYYRVVSTKTVNQPIPETVSLKPSNDWSRAYQSDSSNRMNSKFDSSKVSLPIADLTSDLDPVCEMKIDTSNIADTTFYQGDIIGFCSRYCKDEFSKHPEKYASRY